ncbi:YIP1 family protein [Haliea sp.]|uniref:YIP1 family protein n=1 Tax=Haliea sp. TaxID=1932666 RepID=UPI003526E395
MNEKSSFDIQQIIEQVRAIITQPVSYFQSMPRAGGFGDPVVFVAVMGAVAGVIAALFALFGSAGGLLVGVFGALIFGPLMAVLGAFIGAAVLYVIWKLMGSTEDYEAAFRCQAALAALYPVSALLGIIPYIGSIVTIAWAAWLLVEASVAVHGRQRKTAQIVFGVLAVLFIFTSLGSERASREMETRMEAMGGQFEDLEDLSPEEAGRKMGEFLKGLEEGAQSDRDQ